MRLDMLNRSARSFAVLLAAGVVALLAACTTAPTPSTNYKTTHRLVFPIVASALTIDGLANEAAWTSGFRFVMEDGGAFPAATLRGVADANAIYLYVEVEDTDFNDSDVMVIGLNPDNAAANYRRIHVFPCKPTGICPANGSSGAAVVEYWTGSFGGSTYSWTSQPSAGIEAKSATATAGAIKKWSVEIKIPRGAPFNFVDTNFFGLFVDVARTDPNAGIAGEATQYTWPPAQFIGGGTENDILSDLESGTLAPSAWGNATLSAAFGNGVTISSNEIRTNHPSDPGKIRINDPNVFYATAANYSSSGGTLGKAKAVAATFKIANNGLPALGSFANVPVSGNPAGPVDIDPTVAHTYQTGVWSLTSQQKIDYTANPNQCIRVELTSTDASTVFINASAMRNMQFVTTNSPFRETAVLTAKGVETPAGKRVAFTLRESFVNFDPRLKWTTEIGNATRMRDRLYRAELAGGSAGQLNISVTPPEMRIPSEAVQIAPGTGGANRPAVKMEVGANQLLTFIASGEIDIGGQRVTAAGAAPAGDKQSADALSSRAGALVGSFDARTWFVIGNTATIKVPQDARVLHLKVQDDPKRYEMHKGEGYQLQVVRTPIEPWMLAANPELSRKVSGSDVFMTVGANLPTWLLRGERDTSRFITINKKSYRVFEPVGSFGYIVKRIN